MLRINYIQLMNVLSDVDLPIPTHRGEVISLAIMSRVDAINLESNHVDPAKISFSQLNLEAVRLSNGHREWLEWEFVF